LHIFVVITFRVDFESPPVRKLKRLRTTGLDDLHGVSPFPCDTVTILVYPDQFSCHCVFIYSNFH